MTPAISRAIVPVRTCRLEDAQGRQRSFRGNASPAQGRCVRPSLLFDAQAPPHATVAPVFDPNAQCPAYVVNPKIAQAALAKQRADDLEYMQLVKDDMPVAPNLQRTGRRHERGFTRAIPGRSCRWRSCCNPDRDRTARPAARSVGDKDGSLANKIFGALPKAKAASQAHVASTDGIGKAAPSCDDRIDPPPEIKHWFPN